MGECISFYSSEKIGEVKHCQQFLIPSGRTHYLQVFNEKLKSQGYKCIYIGTYIMEVYSVVYRLTDTIDTSCCWEKILGE